MHGLLDAPTLKKQLGVDHPGPSWRRTPPEGVGEALSVTQGPDQLTGRGQLKRLGVFHPEWGLLRHPLRWPLELQKTDFRKVRHASGKLLGVHWPRNFGWKS